MVVNQIIIVHEPIAERRVHHKLREKTIFNSKSVQWKHQKGLRFHHRVVKLHIEYFFMTFQWLKKSGQNVSRKDGFCLWDANKYNKLLDNHLYSFSGLDPHVIEKNSKGKSFSPLSELGTGRTQTK